MIEQSRVSTLWDTSYHDVPWYQVCLAILTHRIKNGVNIHQIQVFYKSFCDMSNSFKVSNSSKSYDIFLMIFV